MAIRCQLCCKGNVVRYGAHGDVVYLRCSHCGQQFKAVQRRLTFADLARAQRQRGASPKR